MNEKYIQSLIRLVEDSDIDSLEITSWGRKIKIVGRQLAGSNSHESSSTVVAAPVAPPPAAVAPAPAPQAAPPAPAAQPEDTGNLVPIKSPMVGTFYEAPSPDAAPYVSPNEKITAGQVVCIVEAMKLMNEIESDVAGRVVKVMAENAKPVEFGQVLFLVEPDK